MPETALRLDRLVVDVPVVLAPMAGVTDVAYRTLCREQAMAGVRSAAGSVGPLSQPAGAFGAPVGSATPSAVEEAAVPILPGLFVCEMITSRGLVEGDATTRSMLAFDDAERVRSVQLYGTDPQVLAEATRILCGDFGVTHVDLNFGCPVPKVTRKGGGAVLPWKRSLLRRILEAVVAVAAPEGVPVTMKTRKGIDEDHLTALDAGRIAGDCGVAAITLHGRTAIQGYSGVADWDAIADLVDAADIPVLGNGDVWEAADAVRMLAHTGAAGVVVGRGCLGRPWLFRDLAATLGPGGGADGIALPTLGEVCATMRRHAELLARYQGEARGCQEFRKHVAWYLKGFRAGGELRHALALIHSLADLDALLSRLDPDEPFPVSELGRPRGRQGAPRRGVAMPDGWLTDRDDEVVVAAEDARETSGG